MFFNHEIFEFNTAFSYIIERDLFLFLNYYNHDGWNELQNKIYVSRYLSLPTYIEITISMNEVRIL